MMCLQQSASVARSQSLSSVPVVTSRKASRVVCKAKQKVALSETGFVTNDNSGKGNIFPTQQKAYYSSPTSEEVATSGLGGLQGAGVVLAALALVGLATVGVVGKQTGDTLSSVQTSDVEGLAAIASRLSSSL